MRLPTSKGVRRVYLVLAAAVLAAAAFAIATNRAGTLRPLRLEIRPSGLPADGASTARLLVAPAAEATFSILDRSRTAVLEGNRLRAGVSPGSVVVEARAPGFVPARARLETYLAASDEAGDGTPDFLRLGDEADRRAFTGWFTFLAEAQAFAKPPAEVTDCAGLARFAYREALRDHGGPWAADLDLTAVPALPPVRKYQYPFTPLGPRLFRVLPGAFTPSDLTGTAFAEFADAQTLVRGNCHFITRDVRRAEPADLLFFRQLQQSMPFHLMVFVGPSQIEPGGGAFVVYHTGPIAHGPGEVRRPSLEELLAHPLPQWRPLPANNNFLGVYRWNILRD